MSPSKPVRVAFIASASHSGSTILGMVLGSDPRAVFAGEVNKYRRLHELSRQRNERGRCGCGAWYEDCHFWNGVWRRCPPAMDLHPSSGFSWRNLGLVLRLFLPGAGSPDRRVDGDHTAGDAYAEAIAAIRDEAAERDPRIDLVVDSSKSLRSVEMLAQSANVELFVIHLIRDGALVAASYKRRGKGALDGMAAWLYNYDKRAAAQEWLHQMLRRRRHFCGIEELAVNEGDGGTRGGYIGLVDFEMQVEVARSRVLGHNTGPNPH